MSEQSLDLRKKLNEFSEVLPNLFVTGYYGINADNIRKHNIKCLINMATELPLAKFSGVQSFKYSMSDVPEENIGEHFDTICDKISSMHKKRKNVVIHCAAGCSRSVTIVLAYLMKFKDMDLKAAYKFVKERREVIQPNFGFFRQLIEYEMHIFGRNTVKMITTRDSDGHSHEVPDVYLNE